MLMLFSNSYNGIGQAFYPWWDMFNKGFNLQRIFIFLLQSDTWHFQITMFHPYDNNLWFYIKNVGHDEHIVKSLEWYHSRTSGRWLMRRNRSGKCRKQTGTPTDNRLIWNWSGECYKQTNSYRRWNAAVINWPQFWQTIECSGRKQTAIPTAIPADDRMQRS